MAKAPSLLKNSAVVFGGNMILNVANLVFNVLMVRLLSPGNFGALAALVGTMAIVGIPASALLNGFLKFAADFTSRNELGKLRYLWASSLRFTGLLGVIAMIIAIVAAGPITTALHVNQPEAFIFLLLSIPIGLMAFINRGLVQGLERFEIYALSLGAEGITKVIAGFFLVTVGLQLNGAALAISIAAIAALVSTWPGVHHLRREEPVRFQRRTLLQFSALALVVTLVGTVFLNADFIVAKRFLSADNAGAYAAVSQLAKTILYIVSAIATAMMARVARIHAEGGDDRPVLIQALKFTGAASLAIFAVCAAAPRWVLGLYAPRYVGSVALLLPLSEAMLLYALANVLIYYFLSIGSTRIVWALVVSAFAFVGLLSLQHGSASELATAMLSSCAVLFVTLTATYLTTKPQSSFRTT